MNSTRQYLSRAIVLVFCAFGVAACGGGGSGTQVPAATASVPAAISTSVAALVTWASELPQSDTAEPLSTASFTPPVSDTTLPMTIM